MTSDESHVVDVVDVVVIEVQVHPSARRGKGRDATLAIFMGKCHDLVFTVKPE